MNLMQHTQPVLRLTPIFRLRELRTCSGLSSAAGGLTASAAAYGFAQLRFVRVHVRAHAVAGGRVTARDVAFRFAGKQNR